MQFRSTRRAQPADQPRISRSEPGRRPGPLHARARHQCLPRHPLRTGPGLPARSNRLAGSAVLHAVTQLPTSAIVLDLAGLRATKIQLNGRRVRRFTPAGRAARGRTRRPAAGRTRPSPWTSATRATRRRAAASGAKWAGRNSPTACWWPASPTAPPPGSPATTTRGTRPATASRVTTDAELPGRVQRRAGLPHQPGQPRDLGLRAGRTHGHLPGHGADRPLRAPDARCRAALGGSVPQYVAVPASLADAARAGPGPPAGDDADLHQLLRALPVPGVHGGGHRGRAGDPARSTDAVHPGPQPSARRTGSRSG